MTDSDLCTKWLTHVKDLFLGYFYKFYVDDLVLFNKLTCYVFFFVKNGLTLCYGDLNGVILTNFDDAMTAGVIGSNSSQ